MKQTTEYATKRRVGCVMWLAIVAILMSGFSLIADMSQEMAWDSQVEQAAARMAEAPPSGTATPSDDSSQVSEQQVQAEEALRPTVTSVPSVTTPMPEIAALPGIGVDVMVGDVRWNLASAQNLGSELRSDNEFIGVKTTPGKFIKVTFDMENRSAEMLTYAGINLVDSQGRTFTEYSGASSFIPENEDCSFIVNINPNVPKRCTLIFEVAADAVELKASVGDLEMFGGGEAYINLGL